MPFEQGLSEPDTSKSQLILLRTEFQKREPTFSADVDLSSALFLLRNPVSSLFRISKNTVNRFCHFSSSCSATRWAYFLQRNNNHNLIPKSINHRFSLHDECISRYFRATEELVCSFHYVIALSSHISSTLVRIDTIYPS